MSEHNQMDKTANVMDIVGMPESNVIDHIYRYFPVSHRDKAWGCYAVTSGYARIPPYASYPPRGHPRDHHFEWANGRILSEYALVYIASGRGVAEVAHRRRRPVESGHVLFITPGVWHRYRPDPVTGWTEYWVGFDGSIVRALHRNGFFHERRWVYRLTDETVALQLFHMMLSALRENRPALQQVLAGITLHLLGELYARNRAAGRSPRKAGATAIQKALGIMQARPTDTSDIAREVGLSERTFRREFKRHTGLSPHQYCLQLRMTQARRWLTESSMSIKEIAADCGFQDVQYFSRLFKKKVGLSPAYFRMNLDEKTPGGRIDAEAKQCGMVKRPRSRKRGSE